MLTKRNLKRWLNLLGVLATGGSLVGVWYLGSGLPVSARVAGTVSILVALLTKAPDLFKKVEPLVDRLDLPDDDTTTVSSPVDAKYVQAAPLPSATPTPVTTSIRPPKP